jgi:hypothetical protein
MEQQHGCDMDFSIKKSKKYQYLMIRYYNISHKWLNFASKLIDY